MTRSDLPRMIYLAAEHRPAFPKSLVKLVPDGALLQTLCRSGLSGAAAELSIPQEQLKRLYDEGSGERGSEAEFKLLAAKAAADDLDMRREDVPFSVFLRAHRTLDDYLANKDIDLVPIADADLGDEALPTPKLIKFSSGLEPLDLVTGGLYQGLTTIIARPGHGKTTLMMVLMEVLREKNVSPSLWYYETEIPMSLMLYRFGPTRKRVSFISGKDRLKTGMITMEQILDEVSSDPEPERIIFLDSPDVIASGDGDNRRFSLEHIYRQLVQLKGMCKHVFVSSQPRRKDSRITLESGAEAWSKAWYSDIVLGFTKLNHVDGQGTRVRLNVVKNRFGIPDQEIIFLLDYANLTYRMHGRPQFSDAWDDEGEERDW